MRVLSDPSLGLRLSLSILNQLLEFNQCRLVLVMNLSSAVHQKYYEVQGHINFECQELHSGFHDIIGLMCRAAMISPAS